MTKTLNGKQVLALLAQDEPPEIEENLPQLGGWGRISTWSVDALRKTRIQFRVKKDNTMTSTSIPDGNGITKIAGPTYYVRHPDDTYTAADPQPMVLPSADVWDDSIKTLMSEIGYPDSNNVYAAIKSFQMRVEMSISTQRSPSVRFGGTRC